MIISGINSDIPSDILSDMVFDLYKGPCKKKCDCEDRFHVVLWNLAKIIFRVK